MKDLHYPRILFALVLLLLFLVPTFFAVHYFRKYQTTYKLLLENPLVPESEKRTVIDRVSKLIDLPSDEDPTVATISDVDKLKDQPFFSKAKNGDKILVYSAAKKAILYDPLSNKILEVGPLLAKETTPSAQNISFSTQTSQPLSPSATPESSLLVVLYNGTTQTGLTRSAEKKLREYNSRVEIVSSENAQNPQYEDTLVIDLTVQGKTTAEDIASLFGGVVSELPKGEEKPQKADLLIILGSDQLSPSPRE